MKKLFSKKAFTLIELLIVVAIIAILAAIAVPNFLEAQTRAKVSRIKADIRTMVTAFEAYQIDWNVTAPEAGNGPFPARTIDGLPGQTGIVTPAISTPISYISNSDLRDVFFTNDGAARPDVQLFTYKSYDWEWDKGVPVKDPSQGIGFNEGSFLPGTLFLELYGRYRILSVGPDRDWDNDPTNNAMFSSPSMVGLPYDSSNGTISPGSIVRSQRDSDQQKWVQIP